MVRWRFRSVLDKSIWFFAFYSSWMLAVPFMGQTLGARAGELGLPASELIDMITALAIFAGLIIGGFYASTKQRARRIIYPALAVAILGTPVYLMEPSGLWSVVTLVLPFSTGFVIACWGYYYRMFDTPERRLYAAAKMIILSNAGMILINTVAVNLSAKAGIGLSTVALGISLLLYIVLDREWAKEEGHGSADRFKRDPAQSGLSDTDPLLRRALVLLYIFIVIITVDSGLMYQVVRPAFAHHEFLTSFYWAIPYIGTIFLMTRMPEHVRRSRILYVAVGMIGFAFILFFLLDKSAASYIAIDTLMLGAFGICDLFWWVILGELLMYAENPAKIFGLGLSANVLGVLIGSVAGSLFFTNTHAHDRLTAVAVGIVLVSLLALPHLYENLARVIKNQAFLEGLFVHQPQHAPEEMIPEGEPAAPEVSAGPESRMQGAAEVFGLTGREQEIAELLSTGITYRKIAQELFISENTVKTHIKNIYSKMNVRSKTEFLEMIKITRKV